METLLSDQRKRIVRKDEATKSGKQTDKTKTIDDLAAAFIDPDTNESILPGEAVEFGDYEDPTEMSNILRKYMPDVYKKLEWDKNKTAKTQRVVSIEPKQVNGTYVIWVKRLL